MTELAGELFDLRMADLFTFLAVHRTGSISGAARELKVTPSQVSKAVARLEQRLESALLVRGTRGVALSEAGHRLLPPLEELANRLRALRRSEPGVPELAVAAPSWLLAAFLPPIAASLPSLRLRGLELPPSLVRAFAAENLFALTFTVGASRLPASWSSEPIGEIRSALFAVPSVAKKLGPQPVDVAAVRAIPFVTPIYSANGHFVPVNDDCPLSRADRKLGHEAQTISLALELAAESGQLVFGPVIAARAHLERKALVEVQVEGWDVREPVSVACREDAVVAKVHRAIVGAARATLARVA